VNLSEQLKDDRRRALAHLKQHQRPRAEKEPVMKQKEKSVKGATPILRDVTKTKEALDKQWERQYGNPQHAYDMAWFAKETVFQLRGIAVLISGAKSGEDITTERTHLLATMKLFAEQLEQAYLNLDEVTDVLEHMTLKAAANS
jgi:hypothetical protein